MVRDKRLRGYLVLEDGTLYKGWLFGDISSAGNMGEVVFNTGMTGYQEILTDPSYCGQIVTMTYPMIGNYGINSTDSECDTSYVKGYVVREWCQLPGNYLSEMDINAYLKENGIPGIYGVDTRALTRKLREQGTMNGIITSEMPSLNKIDNLKDLNVKNPVDIVTTKEKYKEGSGKYKVAMLDYGYKRNILKSLVARDCTVTVFPGRTSADEILSGDFDGIMLTNGPGDPKDNEEIIKNLKVLLDKLPIFGICLGHQLLALAADGDTQKLKFGHRGCNHPVWDKKMDRTYITSQNHGYTIIPESLDSEEIEVTHINKNDDTIEGMRFLNKNVFSVQFHPEACPGPKDTAYLFDDFINMMEVE